MCDKGYHQHFLSWTWILVIFTVEVILGDLSSNWIMNSPRNSPKYLLHFYEFKSLKTDLSSPAYNCMSSKFVHDLRSIEPVGTLYTQFTN